jgi:hypothetical protein
MEEFLKSSYKRLHLGGQYLSVILADLETARLLMISMEGRLAI